MKKIAIILCLLWMVFISYMSSLNGIDSNKKSYSILNGIKSEYRGLKGEKSTYQENKQQESGNKEIATNTKQLEENNKPAGTITKQPVAVNKATETNVKQPDTSNKLSATSAKQTEVSNKQAVADVKPAVINSKQSNINSKKNITVQGNKRDAKLNLWIRKNAHAFEYLMLSILVAIVLYSYKLTDKNAIVYVLFVCLLYAVIDEFHQSFVPGRTSMVSDVLIDFLGSIVGIVIFQVIYHLRARKVK